MEYNYKKQHAKGKLHAYERIQELLDFNSFAEYAGEAYDGVITGFGTMEGRRVAVYSQDFTVMGGSLGKVHGEKIANMLQLAVEERCPVIAINDSGGARIQEGIYSLAGYGRIFHCNTMASGLIPQISVVAGPCAGGAVYSAGLMDFVFLVKDLSNMFVTGPKVVKQATYQNVTADELGGAKLHASISGVAHFTAANETDCYSDVKRLLRMVPHFAGDYKLNDMNPYSEKDQSNVGKYLPDSAKRTYDVKMILKTLLDSGSFIEVQKDFAKNIVVGFGSLSGIKIGVIANQPDHLMGVLDYNASNKAARFIRYCDAFGIPLVTIVDVPGFMPGIQQEEGGIIRHGAKLLYAYSEATVPKVTVVLRKAYGGAYIAMCSKHLGADRVLAWPRAEVAVMGAESAVNMLYHKERQQLDDEKGFWEAKIRKYNEECMNPDIALTSGCVDQIIKPEDTRRAVFTSLIELAEKSSVCETGKKHGNIPL